MRIPEFRAFLAAICLSAALIQPASAENLFRVFYDANQPIPDNDANGVDIPFDFTGEPGSVFQVAVSFDGDGPCTANTQNSFTLGLKHAFISDLTVQLIAPNGQTVTLFSNLTNGFGGENLCNVMFSDFATTPITSATSADAPFPGFWIPEESLTLFQGLPVSGVWRLRLIDTVRNDIGIFQSGSVYISTIENPSSTIPPQIEIELPPPVVGEFASPITTFNGPSVSFSGTATDLGGSIDRIEYLIRNSGNQTFNFQPATDVSADGTEWTITEILPVDEISEFYVRAVNTNGDVGPIAQRFGTTLSVPDSPPTITVTTPPSEEQVTVSSASSFFLFRGTASTESLEGLDTIQFREGTSGSFIDVVELDREGPTTWNYSYEFLGEAGSQVTVQFRVRDLEGFLSEPVTRNLIFSRTNQIPVVDIIDPNGNESFTSLLNSRIFRGSALDSDGSVADVEFRIPINETELDPEIWNSANDVSEEGDFSRWQFTAEFEAEPLPSTLVVQVRAQDNGGQFSTPIQTTLNVISNSQIRPSITITNPTENAAVSTETTQINITGTVVRQNVSLETVSDFSEQQVIRLALTNENGTTNSLIELDPPTYNSFSTTVPLEVGTNEIVLSAVNKLGFQSLPSGTSERIFERATPEQILNPGLTINFPALMQQTVARTQTSIAVSGRTNVGTFPIQTVLYSFGPDENNLSAELPVNSVSGNFTEWTIQLPLQVFENLVNVVAVDTEGNRSPVQSRTIRRSPTIPIVNILSPANNFLVQEGETNIQVAGTTFDPDGAIGTLQYRVITQFGFFINLGSQTVSFFQPVIDNSDEGDFSSWVFNAPLGPGANTVEIRVLDDRNIEVNRVSLTINAPSTIDDLYLIR